MNLLLDTHIALWAITDSPQLSKAARDLILTPRATVWVSAASVWEIAIKHRLGRGDMPISGADAISHFRAAGYRLLPIEAEHCAATETLRHTIKTPSTGFWRPRPKWNRCACSPVIHSSRSMGTSLSPSECKNIGTTMLDTDSKSSIDVARDVLGENYREDRTLMLAQQSATGDWDNEDDDAWNHAPAV